MFFDVLAVVLFLFFIFRLWAFLLVAFKKNNEDLAARRELVLITNNSYSNVYSFAYAYKDCAVKLIIRASELDERILAGDDVVGESNALNDEITVLAGKILESRKKIGSMQQ